MPPLHAAAATPSQKLAAAARRERERKIAAQARPDTPIVCPSASARSKQASGLRPRLPAVPPPTEPPRRIRRPVRIWFWIVDEINPSLPSKLTIEDIQSAVERHCKVGHLELISARRTTDVVRPRQIAMFLAKDLTPHSLPVIGRKFGGRDHTTVLHAVRRIETLRVSDKTLAADLDAIRHAIAAPVA
jgi:hypothetical protein